MQTTSPSLGTPAMRWVRSRRTQVQRLERSVRLAGLLIAGLLIAGLQLAELEPVELELVDLGTLRSFERPERAKRQLGCSLTCPTAMEGSGRAKLRRLALPIPALTM
jgi:hypothetical protein